MPSIALDKPRAATCAGGHADNVPHNRRGRSRTPFVRLPRINGLDFQQDLANAGSDQRNHSEDPSRPHDAENAG